MVHSDTIVGIVGAALLVAVMVGVFVYEVNNADGGPDGDGGLATFQERYPALDPEGDIDGDGTGNLADDDMDGDGLANADDGDVVFRLSESGSRPPEAPGGSGSTFALAVDGGNIGVTVYLNYTATLPPPLPLVPDFAVGLQDGNGTAPSQAMPPQRTDTAVTEGLEVADGLDAGTYDIVVTQPSGGPGGEFTVEAVVRYGVATA